MILLPGGSPESVVLLFKGPSQVCTSGAETNSSFTKRDD